MTVRELDKLIRNDGWYLVKQVGSHMQYKHPTKAGKVTIPNHRRLTQYLSRQDLNSPAQLIIMVREYRL